MIRLTGILFFATVLTLSAAGQDTLPSFSVVNRGNNRIITSWTNPYGKRIHQLSIQRSFDSTKNFQTILTLPDPTVPQNGYADTKATSEHMFYRLYILLDSGQYIFSKSKRPRLDTARAKEPLRETKPLEQAPVPVLRPEEKIPVPEDHKTVEPDKKETGKLEPVRPKEIPERIIYIKRRDTLVGQIGERSLRRFRDSLATRTRDTLTYNTADTIVLKPFIPREIYRPSKFVFTDKDGNVKIILPLVAEKKYTLKFYDDLNMPVMEIKQIKDSPLTLDKANFVHAGWFRFELYEDGEIKEKHKLFIAKEF